MTFLSRAEKEGSSFHTKRDEGDEVEGVDKCPLKSRLEDQTLFIREN